MIYRGLISYCVFNKFIPIRPFLVKFSEYQLNHTNIETIAIVMTSATSRITDELSYGLVSVINFGTSTWDLAGAEGGDCGD
jgi:hypothetical protein